MSDPFDLERHRKSKVIKSKVDSENWVARWENISCPEQHNSKGFAGSGVKDQGKNVG
jgi:predicted phage gp36 major capsid-like protein